MLPTPAQAGWFSGLGLVRMGAIAYEKVEPHFMAVLGKGLWSAPRAFEPPGSGVPGKAS